MIYAWCLERIDPEHLDEWKTELVDLLPWQSVKSQAAVDLESESFFAMQNAGGG